MLDTIEYSIESLEEDYPSIYMNHSKELDVSKVFNDQAGMNHNPITDRGTLARNIMETRFHTFTLGDIKFQPSPSRSRTFTLRWQQRIW